MHKKLLFSILICFFVLFSLLSLNAQWARIYGGSDFNFDFLPSIQQTSDGGYIVTGLSESFGAGSFDFWVLKLTLTGEIEWQRAYGGIYGDVAYSIQQTSDGGYIVTGLSESFGAGSFDFWVLKLTLTGEIEWQRAYGGIYWDVAYSIQQTSDGGYVVAGLTSSYGAGYEDSWILKLNSVGDIEWQYTYGGSQDDSFHSIQQTSDGGYIAAGDTVSFGEGSNDIWVLKLFSTGDIEWQYTYGSISSDYASSIQQTSDGGYIVAGSSESFGDIDSDFWILKLDSNGDIEWQYVYGAIQDDSFHSIQQTSDGGYIVAGDTLSFGDGSDDIWVLKLFSTGEIEWQRAYGGDGGDYARSIQQTSDGGYVVAGYTSSFGMGSVDFWILKLNSSGEIEWQRAYGGSNGDYAQSIQQTSDGGYVIAGHTWSFGIHYDDFFIIKLYPDGDIDSSCGLIGTSDALIINTDVTLNNTFITRHVTDATHSDTDCTVQDTSASIVVLCEAPKYSLKISASNGGTTDPVPGTHTYYDRTEVSITASPKSGYRFTGWGGDVSGTTNPITITMDSDKSLIVYFNEIRGKESPFELPCFIATAAYGSPLHPYVNVLRDFRDKYLMPNTLGQSFVDVYYKYSPFVADIIAKHKALKIAVQIHLLPLVVFCYSMVYFGPMFSALVFISIFMLPTFLNSISRRKLKRTKA
ncbi:MAG: hypothetical protein OEY25_03790 [Candidatus Aminicenantes bacterium]|nr:hypothetical protein [Candidatus Aminicenantes bacterium]